MRWAVFKDTLQTGVRDVLLWGIGLALVGMLMTAMVPAFESANIIGFLEEMPAPLLAIAGLGEDVQALATPEGIIAAGFFAKFLLIFVVYPVVMGLRITANDEAQGSLNMLLSLPLPRRRLILEKFAAYTLNIIAVVSIATLGLLVGTAFNALDVNRSLLLVMSVSLVPLLVFVLALTAFLGAWLREKRLVTGLVTGIIGASFMLYTIGTMVSGAWMDIPAAFSFFNYYDAQAILSQGGFMPLHVSTLLAGTTVLLLGALQIFPRRDIA